jgi:hypothetical protein
MSPVVSPLPSTRHRPVLGRSPHARSFPNCSPISRRSTANFARGALASYLDAAGRARELVVLPGRAGSALVLDRDAITLSDRRLIAHLAADEPFENAALVCRHYLEDTDGRWCRRVQPEDLQIAPFAQTVSENHGELEIEDHGLVDPSGNSYRLGLLPGERSTDQLRWCRRLAGCDDSSWEQIRLRDVIAAFESYEPIREMTQRAITRYQHDPSVLVARLRCEFDRLCASPIVLNRGLREAVLDAIERYDVSMSEIALRCGIVKRDRRGKASGETSWLARRIGVMPEGGEKEVTPWVHSEVLAVIARDGLCISPREVEIQ